MKGIGSLPLVAMFCLTVIQPLSGSAQQSGAPMAAYWLQYVCSQDSNDSAAGFCQGAIEAFYSVMEDACVPSEVLPQEIKQSVLEALRATRFSPLEPAADFVWGAIDSQWPCEIAHIPSS
jgi:hypothetical protein